MDKKTFFVLLFIAATGLCTGSFFEVYMSGDGKDQLMGLLSSFFDTGSGGLSLLASFWQSLKGSLLFLLLCFLSPLVVILLPLNVILLFFRGLFLGFSATMLIETFGMKGILYVAVTLVPSGLLLVLLFTILNALSLREGMITIQNLRSSRLRHRGNRKALQIFTGQYLYYYAAGLAVLIFTCLLQAFLLQVVI